MLVGNASSSVSFCSSGSPSSLTTTRHSISSFAREEGQGEQTEEAEHVESGDRLGGIHQPSLFLDYVAERSPVLLPRKFSALLSLGNIWKHSSGHSLKRVPQTGFPPSPLQINGREDGCPRNDLTGFASFMRACESSCS